MNAFQLYRAMMREDVYRERSKLGMWQGQFMLDEVRDTGEESVGGIGWARNPKQAASINIISANDPSYTFSALVKLIDEHERRQGRPSRARR